MPVTTQTMAKAGAKSVYGLAKEATFATVVTPSVYFEPINPQLTADNSLYPRPGIRNTLGQTPSAIGRVVAKGSLELSSLPDTLGQLLFYGLGADAYTAGSGGTAGTGSHVLKMASPLNSLTISADYGAGTVHQFAGMKVDGIDFSAKQNTPLSTKLTLLGVKDVTTSASLGGSATYSTLSPYLFEHITAVTLGGAAVPLDSFNISLKNNLKARWYGGSGNYPGAIDEVARMVTGTISLAYVSEAVYALMQARAPIAFSVTFTHPSMAAGSTPYSLTIALPSIILEAAQIDPKRADITQYSNVKFSAFESAAGAQDDITVTVVDAASAVYS